MDNAEKHDIFKDGYTNILKLKENMNKTIAFYVVMVIVLATLSFISIYFATHGKEFEAVFTGLWMVIIGGGSLTYLYDQKY